MSRPFRVWAPRADTVTLVLDGATVDGARHEVPMTGSADGWWAAQVGADVVADGAEVDYGFRLDDADTVLPDPRSRRQPAGVHQLSRTYDPAAHAWQDTAWTGRQLAGGLIYEMHIGTFTPQGTFDAAIDKLDHLVGLGVTLVEILPVNAFNGEHNWGYDGVLWFAVQEQYGGPAGYQRFVDACHAAGLGVIQDVVYNHLGASGNYLPSYGPYLHDDGRGNTWGDSVNLDGPDSGEVRRFILDNVTMWLRDHHVDGLRLDAVHALQDHSAVHLLEEMAQEVAALSAHLGRPLTLIAESDLNDPKLITPREAGGYGLTAQWNDDFHHVLHVALTGETVGYYSDFGSMEAIAKVVTEGFFHNGTWSSFRGRKHGRRIDPSTLQAWRFVGYLQDHDQIGNRAAGDRISDKLTSSDLFVGAVLVLTGPFTPMLFMGEEWAASTPWQFFTSHPEPELGEATAKGRLAEFAEMGWDPDTVPNPQDPETFTRSKLNWSETTEPGHADLLDLYRRLAALRRARPELTDPRFTEVSAQWDDDQRWLVIDRSGVRIAVNLSTSTRTVPLRAPAGDLLLATDDAISVQGSSVTLPANTAAVIAPVG
ncbi:malto-oligosyltrehalose trehalohydrolase [Nakamurella flavida]|uniref:Malto-oligosyltrehalose trehalohydrolase n=1 Tax=Nakamurella flavida TaxID=363630 RepID=A0A939C1A8_9ACTN|nr:malto-oligosyltrehalose trehalohydrolase [Nakamurella flavida]MBM9475260.1 malto-oligosyltrehalose trehalohydrolase [Nakamurella flavida]MDP9776834.1 maltooligosyltrehalose trehalohydrolase [Nakamurella flavida]